MRDAWNYWPTLLMTPMLRRRLAVVRVGAGPRARGATGGKHAVIRVRRGPRACFAIGRGRACVAIGTGRVARKRALVFASQVQVSSPEGQNHPLPREMGIGPDGVVVVAEGRSRQGVNVPLPYPNLVQYRPRRGLGEADIGRPN